MAISLSGGLVLEAKKSDLLVPVELTLPRLPDFLRRDAQRNDYGTQDLRQGFSIELWIRMDSLEAGQVLAG